MTILADEGPKPHPVPAASSAPVSSPAVEPPIAPAKGHLRSVDVVRIVTVAGVISVHSVSMTTGANNHVAGAVISLLHVNREVFLLLSAFVLTYAYGRRASYSIPRFWKRRYWFVLVPYVGWSAIYVGINGHFSSFTQGLSRFGFDLLHGTAEYHLYFLLLSMQLYLIYPLLLRGLKALRRHHLALLATSFVAQACLTAFFMYFPSRSGILGYWVSHPNANLLSYQFYVIAGGVAALHLEELVSWVESHRPLVATTVVATFGLGVANYLANLSLAHMSVSHSSAVFQPIIAVEAIAAAMGLLCLGQWVVSRASRGSRRSAGLLRVAGIGSDTSFGVYLAHPLILEYLLRLGVFTGIVGAIRAAGIGPTLAFDALILIPVVFLIAATGVSIARRTPLSLVLTGRAAAMGSLGSRFMSIWLRPTRLTSGSAT